MKNRVIDKLKRIAIPALLTLWAIFIIMMYCRVFIIPRLIEFIMR